MSVDDMAVYALDFKIIENTVADLFIVAESIVMTFLFMVGLLVSYEISLESSHGALVEERGVRSAPEIEVIVAGCVSVFRFGVSVEGGTHKLFGALQQAFST